MEAFVNLLTILNILGAVQGFLLALALVGIRGSNQRSNKLLAALVLTTSITVIGSVLYATRYIMQVPFAIQIFSPFQFLIGPLLFLYVKTLTLGKAELGKNYLLHFIPTVLCFVYYLPLYFQDRESKLEYLLDALQNYPIPEWLIKSYLLGFHILMYLILSVYVLIKLSKKSSQQSNIIENKNLPWLRNFLIIALVVWAVGVFRLFFAYNLRPETMLISPLSLSIWVYILGYLALRSPEVLAGVEENLLPPAKRYEKSTLTSVKAKNTLGKLLQLMTDEKPFTDGELTLQKLAEQLSISPHHLSQIINEQLNQNFFDFINSYRIEEVKRIMADSNYKHLSIIAIAEEAGFSSKSSFNSIFKKNTGMTPSQFRKNLVVS